ncbi:Bzip transcription factor [Lasiodiplodia theobromae]|uniref:Bzip transcription factor n=1 Tax=Lasiodiplodia theobromae TaxID=45133 RepID=UPI0015C352F1|nr:Bzip transcription factor [Lasiodiplodia theobromae]KAF4536872.1 Bzip transcription factor [Lasiodiplodia theobromae]
MSNSLINGGRPSTRCQATNSRGEQCLFPVQDERWDLGARFCHCHHYLDEKAFLDAAEAQIKDLEARVREQEIAKDNLARELEAERQKNAALERRVRTTTAALDEARDMSTRLTIERDDAAAARDHANAEVSTLSSQMDTISYLFYKTYTTVPLDSTRVNNLEASLSTARTERDAANAERDGLLADNETKTAALDDARETNARLRTGLDNAHETNDSLTTELDDARETAQLDQARVRNLEASLSTARAERDAANAQMDGLLADNETMTAALDDALKTNARLTTERDNAIAARGTTDAISANINKACEILARFDADGR